MRPQALAIDPALFPPMLDAGSASGRVLTEEVEAPEGFESLYRISVYGDGANPSAAGIYVYVDGNGVPGVIVDAERFVVGKLSDIAKAVKPFEIVGGKVRITAATIGELNGGMIAAGTIDASKITAGTLTVDKIKGGEISTRSYSGTSADSATVTVKEKGAVLLVGTFKYDVGKKDRTVVSIKAGSEVVNGGKWECDPGDDLKGVTNIVALQDLGSGAVPRTYVLKRERGKGKISDIRLFALRVAS